MPTLPSIDVSFKALASTLISRSQRGTAILIVTGSNAAAGFKEYSSLGSVNAEDYAELDENSSIYSVISDVFKSSVEKLIVFTESSENKLADFVFPNILLNYTPSWIGIYNGTSTWASELQSWIVEQEKAKKYYKAVLFGASNPDCKHIVNVGNTGTVTFEDERGVQSISNSVGVLLGVLASANVERGVTRALLPGLAKVNSETLFEEEAVTSGKLLYINTTEGVKISVGINSSTSSVPDDLRYIENVEVCDMISDDITNVFEDEYQGKMKNSLDNQMLLISAIRGYFNQLVLEEILDNEYENTVEVDIEAQRNAWISSGVSEAASWADGVVRSRTFKRSVFLLGDIKILGTVDSLKFNIALM